MTEEYDDWLLRLLKEAYEAMRSEAMYCPWCSGYIGGLNTHHDKECAAIVLNFEKEPRDENPAHPG